MVGMVVFWWYMVPPPTMLDTLLYFSIGRKNENDVTGEGRTPLCFAEFRLASSWKFRPHFRGSEESHQSHLYTKQPNQPFPSFYHTLQLSGILGKLGASHVVGLDGQFFQNGAQPPQPLPQLPNRIG